jgi:hypothetical protein
MASNDAAVNPTIALIKQVLQKSPALRHQIAWDAWASEQTILGEKVALFREYADGEHRAKLTPEMKKMLRIDPDDESSPFAINHMDNLIQTVADRLNLTGIKGSSDAATAWITGLGTRNRLQALELEISESSLRDGDTYVLASWDNDAGEVRWTHEEAFDGTEGMIVVYGRDKRTAALAIKIWLEAIEIESNKLENRARVNFYWPDRVQKFIQDGNALKSTGVESAPAAWMLDGRPIGVPVVHFPNQSKRYSSNGMSILDQVITVQDAVNRTITSIIMAAELTAFRIRYLFGIKAPAALQPGMWVNFYAQNKGAEVQPDEEQRKWIDAIRIGDLAQGDLSQLMAQAEFLINAMYEITRIPRKDGTNESGEAKKMRESGLLGRVRRCHIALGNAWEELAALSWRIEAAHGAQRPPESVSWDSQWKPAEVRNDTEIVDNALKIADRIDEETFLELIADVYRFDAAKIDQIMARRAAEAAARLSSMLPAFGTQDSEDSFCGIEGATGVPQLEGLTNGSN